MLKKMLRMPFIVILMATILFPASAFASSYDNGSSQKHSLLSQFMNNLSKIFNSNTYGSNNNSNYNSNNNNNQNNNDKDKDKDKDKNKDIDKNNNHNNNDWDDYDWDDCWDDFDFEDIECEDSYDIWKKWFCY